MYVFTLNVYHICVEGKRNTLRKHLQTELQVKPVTITLLGNSTNHSQPVGFSVNVLHTNPNSTAKTNKSVTWMQPVFGVPDGNPITMEILLSWPMNFELHMHLPVL